MVAYASKVLILGYNFHKNNISSYTSTEVGYHSVFLNNYLFTRSFSKNEWDYKSHKYNYICLSALNSIFRIVSGMWNFVLKYFRNKFHKVYTNFFSLVIFLNCFMIILNINYQFTLCILWLYFLIQKMYFEVFPYCKFCAPVIFCWGTNNVFLKNSNCKKVSILGRYIIAFLTIVLRRNILKLKCCKFFKLLLFFNI